MSSQLPILVLNKKVIDAVSMGADITSEVVDLAETAGYCAHFIWTGVPVGEVVVEGSNDGVNFVEIAAQATGGAADQFLLNVEKHHYRYCRFSFARTSGTGSLTCFVSGKRV